LPVDYKTPIEHPPEIVYERMVNFSEGLSLLLLPPVGWVVAFFWGALWGSFFNVCIHRIPLYESVVSPGSRCPGCGAAIAAYDNVPILSWLLLRGRCRRCRTPISPRYLLVEALMAALTMLLYHRFVASGPGPLPADLTRFIVYFFFTGTLVVLSGIDFDHQILPDRITCPASPLFFLLGRLTGDAPLLDAAIGLAAGYLFVRLIADGYYYLTGREGMGYGDGKLLSLIGGLLGWRALPLTLLLGSLSGLCVTVPVLLLRRRRKAAAPGPPGGDEGPALRHVEVPFGPFLAFGGFLYMYLFVGRDAETVIFRLFGGLLGLDE
jgi:leader peptidase (prepilin peptidase) / N-methyltransferase